VLAPLTSQRSTNYATTAENFLLPIDVKAEREEDLTDEAIALGRVMECLAQAKFTLLILDACRDNPFPPKGAGWTIGGTRGLTIPAAPDGLIAIYSAGIKMKRPQMPSRPIWNPTHRGRSRPLRDSKSSSSRNCRSQHRRSRL